jgi:hypothetical protein
MFEAFALLVMAVIACAAWQFIPAFRWLIKAMLVVAILGAAGGYLYYTKLENDAKLANQARANIPPPPKGFTIDRLTQQPNQGRLDHYKIGDQLYRAADEKQNQPVVDCAWHALPSGKHYRRVDGPCAGLEDSEAPGVH